MNGGDRRLLLFDGGCAKCAKVAGLIGGLHRHHELEPVSLRSETAHVLLESAIGPGWKWRPYYVTMTANRVRAEGGGLLGWRLVRELGLAGAWQVWRTVRSEGPVKVGERPNGAMSRRSALKWFARSALGVSGMILGAVSVTAGVRDARAASPGIQTVVLPMKYWRLATRDEIPAELWQASSGVSTDVGESPNSFECGSCTWYWVGSCGSACGSCPLGFWGPDYYQCIDPHYGTVCNATCYPCNSC